MRRMFAIAFLVLATVGSLPAGESETNASFRLSLVGQLKMEVMGREEKLSSLTTLDYTWKRAGRESTLYFDAADVKVSKDGTEVMNVYMSRDKIKNSLPGQAEEKSYQEAPEKVKALMKDGFGSPMCKVTLDENGAVTRKSIVAGSGAREFLEGGLIANALLFHAPFPKDKQKWEAPAEVSMGNGGYATGPLAYERISEAEGVVSVKVSGVLKNESFRQTPSNPLEFRDVRYEVTGAQSYDAKRHEWIVGELTFDVTYRMFVQGSEAGTVKGVMKVRLKTN